MYWLYTYVKESAGAKGNAGHLASLLTITIWGTTFISTKILLVDFLIGFAVAMAGIFLISFNGSKLELNPLGDLLALLAAVGVVLTLADLLLLEGKVFLKRRS